MKLCTFDGCDKPSRSNKLCSGHNMQRASGRELSPLRVAEYKTFDDLLIKSKSEGDCILWTGSLDKAGYGRMGFRRERNVLVHRVAYQLNTDEEIAGLQIHHTCANRSCFNPEHLQRASAKDNVLEMLGRKDYEAEIAYLKAENARLRALLLERESACG